MRLVGALPGFGPVPRQPPGMGLGLVLAVLAHLLLVLALSLSVNWHTSAPPAVEAELWSAVPQVAAPRVQAPEPVKPAEPVARTEPPPAPAPVPRKLPDPQIAIEKAAREEARRTLEQQREQNKREAARREEEREEQRVRDEQARLKKEQQAEREKQDAARLAALRQANLRRIQGQAGASGDATSTGSAAQSSGPSAGYAGRIKARIKPNIVFADIVSGNPLASVEVRLAPDGTIIGKRLSASSGVPGWDEAVLRAIERTEALPRDTDGRVPPVMVIDFRPHD